MINLDKLDTLDKEYKILERLQMLITIQENSNDLEAALDLHKQYIKQAHLIKDVEERI